MKQQPLLEVDPAARRDSDFYATPAWMTRALLDRLPALNTYRVLEPCVGNGAILRELPEDADVVTNDIVPRDPILPDFLLDARQSASWLAFRKTGLLEVVITNPPFDVAFDIATRAFTAATRGLALLLRLSWLEPTEERSQWLQEHPPTRLIVLPRHDFRGNGSTDSVTSAWMLWAKDATFCKPGIEIVTRAERDQWIRRGVRP